MGQTAPSTTSPPSQSAGSEEQIRQLEAKIEELRREVGVTGLGNFADEAAILFGLAGLALVLGPLVVLAIGIYEHKGLRRATVNETREAMENFLNARLQLIDKEQELQQELLARRVNDAKEELSDKIKKAGEDLRSEITCRLAGEVSFIYGQMGKKGQEVINPGLLQLAISSLKIALKNPKEMEWTYKNNLAAYYAISEDRSNAPEAVRLADELEKRYSESTSPEKHHLLDTYVMVMLHFSRRGFLDAQARLPRAKMFLQWLLESGKMRIEEGRLRQSLSEIDRMLGEIQT